MYRTFMIAQRCDSTYFCLEFCVRRGSSDGGGLQYTDSACNFIASGKVVHNAPVTLPWESQDGVGAPVWRAVDARRERRLHGSPANRFKGVHRREILHVFTE